MNTRIRELRKVLNLNQKEFAQKIGLKQKRSYSHRTKYKNYLFSIQCQRKLVTHWFWENVS